MIEYKQFVPRWVALLAAALCFAAVANLPYGFYMLLRWVVCGVAVAIACQSNQRGRLSWMWIFAVVAVIFNPLFRMHFDKEVWRVLNVLAGAALLLGSGETRRSKPLTLQDEN